MTVAGEAVVRAERLSCTFRTAGRRRVRALAGVDFQARRGRVSALVGPNGSGKTTLLRALLGLLGVRAGSVRLFGLPPRRAAFAHRLGYAPERFDLDPRRSGRGTLRLLAEASGHVGSRAEEETERALRDFGLDEAADRPAGTYSKGMQRRLLLAQAFLGAPDLLVLDEPFDGLDPPGVRHVARHVAEAAARGAAVIVASHQIPELADVADDWAFLYEGRLVPLGGREEWLARGRVELAVEGLDAAGLERLERFVESELGGRVAGKRPDRAAILEAWEKALARSEDPP